MTDSTETAFQAVASLWPVLLLAGFASANLPLAQVLGYRWSVELSLAVFLLAAALFLFFRRHRLIKNSFSFSELRWILLPLTLFILWSFLSAAWSSSWRAAIHHSLLWACYLSFYFVSRIAISDDKTKTTTLKVLGGVLFAIGVAGLVEYLAMYSAGTKAFNERYYSYAEIMASFLPVLAASTIQAERKWSRLALMTSVICWAAILATTSRA